MKKLLIIILAILVIISIFFFFKKDSAPKFDPNIVPQITLLSHTAREAKFESNVPLLDVTTDHVRVFTMSASVGSAGEAADVPDDQISVSYDSKTGTITVIDISTEDTRPEFGIFGTGCASCTHEIEFENIKTTAGTLVPKTQISIY